MRVNQPGEIGWRISEELVTSQAADVGRGVLESEENHVHQTRLARLDYP